MTGNYSIEIVNTGKLYEGLRDLWCRVFGDDPEYVDAVYEAFGTGFPNPEPNSPDAGPGGNTRSEANPESADAASGETGTGKLGSPETMTVDNAGIPEIMGFVVTTDSGKVVSALTCYRCGSYCDPGKEERQIPASCTDSNLTESGIYDIPVYVSYAICTDPEYRGLGLAGELTSYVRDLVLDHGCISILSPAEESLESFYENLGYKRFFTVQEKAVGPASEPGDDELAMLAGIFGSDNEDFIEDDLELWTANSKVYEWGGYDEAEELEEANGFAPELTIEPVDAVLYNKYREAFLADAAHVSMSDQMMGLVRMSGADGNGLRVINGGDAICAVEQLPNTAKGIVHKEPDRFGVQFDKRADGPGQMYATSDRNAGDELGASYDESDGTDGTAHALALTELLINPMLAEFSLEIDEEIAARLAEQYGARETRYRMPGFGRCQSMAAFPDADPTTAVDDTNWDPEDGCTVNNSSPYFGFPVE